MNMQTCIYIIFLLNNVKLKSYSRKWREKNNIIMFSNILGPGV